MRIVEGNDGSEAALTTVRATLRCPGQSPGSFSARRARPESARHGVVREHGRAARDFPVLLDTLVQLVAKETNRRMADVRSAVELTAKQRASLAGALTKFTGYAVDVRVTPEPDLLGGFVATIGDLVIDTSLRHRLEQAKEMLFHPAPAVRSEPPPGARRLRAGTAVRVRPGAHGNEAA